MAKMRMFDAWENPSSTLPAEVQEYINKLNAEAENTIMDINSLNYGTPDGNVTSETWTVFSLYKEGCVTIKHFIYAYTLDEGKNSSYFQFCEKIYYNNLNKIFIDFFLHFLKLLNLNIAF